MVRHTPWPSSKGLATVVERPRKKVEAISAARCAFRPVPVRRAGLRARLKRLRAYRKEWGEDRGVWKDRPRHDDGSHGADAFLTFACSGFTPATLRRDFIAGLR